ncbi:hypothetical protein N1031_11790 [Herbiconiux moechotypicola]|uniref:hypothetical protein n=1 Tax=Herbiconiux moechotypicola TaxID=637393 RepID=UPI00217EC00E|nr:hypothetical protein [Herbiconiux moechotypicola]MCS5730443.1 hypothetical protein [Herbiconiux moechotypicola]
MTDRPTPHQPAAPSAVDDQPRIPRRLLFATAAAGAAATAVAVTSAPTAAEAAPGTSPWLMGGNSGTTTNNFLGPTTSGQPLIFKTRANSSATVSEKMRISPQGRLGLGVTAPAARVDAVSSSTGVLGTCSASDGSGRGVVGRAPGGYGVEGISTNNMGVHGKGSFAGVHAEGGTYGVLATADSGGYAGYFSSGTYGVLAYASSIGLFGSAQIGVQGTSNSNSGTGVKGEGGQNAVLGTNGSQAGVRGESNYVGVWGEGTQWGVYGRARGTTGQNYGVFGQSNSPDGYAIYAAGRMHVNGTLSKSAGSFKIDHPQDPQNKWLSHSFVESPDMMNVYNGNVTTDAKGKATVTLPGYFEALNRDFRYQLTVLGAVFAQAIVSREIAKGSFEISTDKPGVKVSWQVTGIRQDSYATANPIVVEQDKTAAEKGTTVSNARGTAAAAPFAPPTGDAPAPGPDMSAVPKPAPSVLPRKTSATALP